MPANIAKDRNLQTLKKAGIINVRRVATLIDKTIAHFKLDLSGLTILTEAASGPYVVTPIIAARAGASKVIALTRDSDYARAKTVIEQTRALEALCGIEDPVEIHTDRPPEVFAQADVVTNLGFVRPLDSHVISCMKPEAVIALMCEAWEIRPGDIDLHACREKGIDILGTNEDHPGLEVFSYIGWLCLKMLFDAQIEIHKSNVIVISSDKFGSVIEDRLKLNKVKVTRAQGVPGQLLAASDVLVIADYTREDEIIGVNGDISPRELARLAPDITVIQLAGRIDVRALQRLGLTVYPGIPLPGKRMAKTLAELGLRPVIELHAAGLKVGQIAFQNKKNHLIASYSNGEGLIQTIV